MNKNINLGVGIFAIVIFINYLINPEDLELMGIAVNIWVMRAIWIFIAVVQLLIYIRKVQQERSS